MLRALTVIAATVLVAQTPQRQARLLSRTGQPLAVAATVTERDPMMLAIDINLAPLGPGDYLVDVLTGAGAERERRLIAIRVVQ